jgi:peptidoglycan hydrolase-like protein with peptidoglycan-binding domain
MIVLGLAVVATVILLAVVPKEGSLGGVNSVSAGQATGTTLAPATTSPGTTATTAAGATGTTKAATTTTKAATATTKKGSTASTTTTVNPATRPVLKLGSSGPDVIALQQKLTAAGYAVTADGNFGAGTQTAVINFQRAKNLPPDGVVGATTWAALG